MTLYEKIKLLADKNICSIVQRKDGCFLIVAFWKDREGRYLESMAMPILEDAAHTLGNGEVSGPEGWDRSEANGWTFVGPYFFPKPTPYVRGDQVDIPLLKVGATVKTVCTDVVYVDTGNGVIGCPARELIPHIPTKFEPQVDENYYFVNNQGQIRSRPYIPDSESDIFYKAIGNMFFIREHGEEKAKQLAEEYKQKLIDLTKQL